MKFSIFSQKFSSAKAILIICFVPFYFILEANNQYWLLIPIESNVNIYAWISLSMIVGFLILRFFIQAERAILIIFWLAIHYLYFIIIFRGIASIWMLSILKQYKFYLPILFLGIGMIIYLILKMNLNSVKKLATYIVILYSIILIIELYKTVLNKRSIGNQSIAFLNNVAFKKTKLNIRPDVFLIIMDEYAGFKSLNDYYGFKNKDFLNKLECLDFFVAKAPQSNYNSTLFSTLSLFNMSYLDTSSIGDLKSVKAYAKVAKAIQKNVLFDFFKQNNYNVINNSFLRINKTKSDPFLILPIEDRLMMDKTMGSVFQNDLFLNIPSNRVQYLLNTFYAKGDIYNQKAIGCLKTIISDSSSPLFVYTHLMMPHSPYLRDEDGNVREMWNAHKELLQKKVDQSYVNYLNYCNKVVFEIVDLIINQRANAIIVLVSDHGNRFHYDHKIQKYDFSNFISLYSYNKNYNGFTDTITLVNVFRQLLNNQFGQDLKILNNYQINVTKGVLN